MLGFNNRYLVAQHRQAMGAGEPGRPGTYYGDVAASAGGALKGVAIKLHMVSSVALEQAN